MHPPEPVFLCGDRTCSSCVTCGLSGTGGCFDCWVSLLGRGSCALVCLLASRRHRCSELKHTVHGMPVPQPAGCATAAGHVWQRWGWPRRVTAIEWERMILIVGAESD
jgi:hypothetical protein